MLNLYAVEDTLRLQREQAIQNAAMRSMVRAARQDRRPLRRRAAYALHRIADRLEGPVCRPAVP